MKHAAWCLTALFAVSAAAQEAIFTRAATQPGAGILSWRQQALWTRFQGGVDDVGAQTSLVYGVTGNFAVELSAPVLASSGFPGDPAGLGDLTVLAKTRLWQRHTSPIDTQRLGVFAGAALPAGPGAFTGGGVDPIFGAVAMQVSGRHGVNLAAQAQITTRGSLHPMLPGAGTADLYRVDAAYLFRFAPWDYAADSDGAWYLTAEANAFFETNCDREVLLSPGILYEGCNFAAEAAVQLPGPRCVMYRPARDLTVVLGFRLLF